MYPKSSFLRLNILWGTKAAYDEQPLPFYGAPRNLHSLSSLRLNFLSRLSSQSLHWQNESISFFRWVPGVPGALVHQQMASVARVLSIKHVQLSRHLTAALRVQGRPKLSRARTVVVLLIVWHPRGLPGVLAPTPAARVSVRELNYRSFFRSQVEIWLARRKRSRHSRHRSRLTNAVTQSWILYCQYLLLTEFEGRTVSYGPSFFLLDLWPKREARGP